MPVYVGVDVHVKTQTVCWMDTADGEMHQRTLDHQREDVAAFYRQWTPPVTVGVEASGYAQWFHRLVEERGHRLLVGDAHAIRQFTRRRQKNDRRDAALLLDLLLRGLLVEAAQSAVRYDLELRRDYQRLAQRKCRALAKVAMARKLAIRLYWMLRRGVEYAQFIQGSHAGQPESFRGGRKNRPLEWASCLPASAGSLNTESWSR